MKTIKIIIVLFLLTTLVGCSKDVQEEVKYEKLEYSSVEDLIEQLVDDEIEKYENINNVAYTIREDDLFDEFYEYAYNTSYSKYDIIDRQKIWLTYYYAETGQYCSDEKKAFNCKIDDVSINVDYYWYLAAIIIHDGYKDRFEDGIYIYSPLKVYSVKETETQLQAIDNAYIISQGAGTPGYEEAMNWSYEVAVSNGYKGNYYLFSENYKLNIVEYEPQLQEMQGKDIDWLVENYDEYSEVHYTITTNLNILKPTPENSGG